MQSNFFPPGANIGLNFANRVVDLEWIVDAPVKEPIEL